MRALVLFNPAAGQAVLSQSRLAALEEPFSRLGFEFDMRAVPETNGQRLELDLSPFELIIVYGGDGTIHSLLPSIVKAGLPLAILPAGTANVLARELGIPLNLEQALQVLDQGRRRRIFLGQANGRFFHLMAGVGLDAELIARVSSRLKRKMGVASYWLTGLARFWFCPIPHFEVQVEEETFAASFAVISNARYYGGRFLMAPRASLFEDTLDVCIFRSKSRLRYIVYLLGCLSGSHIRFRDVVYRKARKILVSGDPSIRYQLDGEISGHLPARFQAGGHQVEVYVP